MTFCECHYLKRGGLFMKRRTPTRIAIMALCMLTLLALFMPSASAASNVCTQISGSSEKTTTFTVQTGSRWLFSDKITITQTKGEYEYLNWLGNWKTASGYDTYTIKVVKVGGTTKTYTMAGNKITIKLDKNSTYKISVIPGSTSTLTAKFLSKGAFMGWKKYPTWAVTSTKGIISCG